MREPLKWYDHNANKPPWIEALAEVRHLAAREGWRYTLLQSQPMDADELEATVDPARGMPSTSSAGGDEPERASRDLLPAIPPASHGARDWPICRQPFRAHHYQKTRRLDTGAPFKTFADAEDAPAIRC
jgi:hypothetical protein